MNSQYLDFNRLILKHVKSPAEQGRIVAAAVAMAVAAKATLPSSEVGSIDGYYAEQVLPMAMATISEMGETVMFASRTALEYVQIFWKMRYYAAHPSVFQGEHYSYQLESLLSQRSLQSLDFNMLYQGGLLVLSAELNEFLNRFKKEIIILSNSLHGMLAQENTNG